MDKVSVTSLYTNRIKACLLPSSGSPAGILYELVDFFHAQSMGQPSGSGIPDRGGGYDPHHLGMGFGRSPEKLTGQVDPVLSNLERYPGSMFVHSPCETLRAGDMGIILYA